jgi:hypothetical protein
MIKLEKQPFKSGDWVILSEVGIEELIRRESIKRDKIKKMARQVIETFDNENGIEITDLYVRRGKNNFGYATSALYRKATLEEIKIGQIDILFK